MCTLEFEDQRPFYDWLLDALATEGHFPRPLPQQIEFARLNLTYVVLSKRKLIQLVNEGHVEGWDDPRLPTLIGARRRGFTAAGFRRFAERIGVSKADSWIDMSVLEECMRDDLNEAAERRVAVLDPLKLIITNYADGNITAVLAEYMPDSKSGTPGADNYKVMATCTGCRSRTATRPRSASTTASSPTPTPASAARAMRRTSSATSSPTSTPTASASSPRTWSRRSGTPGRKNTSSSNATATSSPTAWTRSPARRCSTAR